MTYKIRAYNQLDSNLYQEWEVAWKKSETGNIFNSPYWFEACQLADPKPTLILTCRDLNNELTGILPLVRGKKFGFTVYMSPGRKYLDKSTLLICNNSKKVFIVLIKYLSKIGNYYLTEISEDIAFEIKKTSLQVGISQCSEGLSLKFDGDPLRNLSKENRRRLRKRLRDDATITWDTGSLDLNLNIIVAKEIEQASAKAKEHKTIFSDIYLVKVCQKIASVSPKLICFTFLYKSREAICYKYGFITHGTYHYSNTAYKTTYQKLSPGRLLMIETFKMLQEIGVNNVDFSRGDTTFKREFSKSKYRQYTIYYQQTLINMFIWKFLYRIKELIIS